MGFAQLTHAFRTIISTLLRNPLVRIRFQTKPMGTKKAPIFWIDAHCFVGILGLEPRMKGPEYVVLPLHHIPRCHAKRLHKKTSIVVDRC